MKEKVRNIFIQYLEKLNLHGYEITVLTEKDKGWEKPKNDTYNTSVDYPYKRVFLHVGKDAETNSNFLLHEAFHVLLWRYTYLAESRFLRKKELEHEEEHIVDHLTNTFYPILK